ncbi:MULTISPECIES: hypothetical protein [Pasteurellaceae]|uniref:Lipoprotein n=1 Tax=Pasteurella atlantica TaxID=2827233 RepID=A0AAW8CLH1_9PAST|nr:hypothetical protein [Pasteurella atlantica]MBR0572760.1 hypothetical protein [Pasteurella atlantica]MDP8038688.1 hypothetical protein [Pasteurella atlantica]MDP8040780.1 hypothetical protein [Pasteurella atlantica]MDP8043047.1 hypothetical protein [Pasteurella atlantica]MDP8045133.1 hypothetical protein [Pasteurella atlantica]
MKKLLPLLTLLSLFIASCRFVDTSNKDFDITVNKIISRLLNSSKKQQEMVVKKLKNILKSKE